MRRFMPALIILLLSAPLWAQEIVVFSDYRSLVVQSHRIQGEWTYLRIAGGEIAVLSKRIMEIHHEAAALQAASSEPAAPAHGPEPQRPQAPAVRPPIPPPVMPFRPRQPGLTNPTPSPDDENDDEENGASDGESDDEEPPEPATPPPREAPYRSLRSLRRHCEARPHGSASGLCAVGARPRSF